MRLVKVLGSGVHGLSHQEASQAHVEEEAPQAASSHAGAAQKTWQVASSFSPATDARLTGWMLTAAPEIGPSRVREVLIPRTPSTTPRSCSSPAPAGSSVGI